MRVLVIGGAGFIGSHTVDALVERGHLVRVFDRLDPQVHGESGHSTLLCRGVEFVQGDVRDAGALRRVLDAVEAIFYLAAAVGVGQSMYEIRRYVEVNSLGAATLLDVLANERHSVRRVVVASSMSVYGEGAYDCAGCGMVSPPARTNAQLGRREWEVHCPMCRSPLRKMPTPERKSLAPTSVYAITKRDHEELFLAVGRAYGVPTVALRYFNVYGPRQPLANPYTGVVAIFASRMRNGRPPLVYEDGHQTRDFVHVSDVTQANLLALEREDVADQVFNVGSGEATTILGIAAALSEALGYGGEIEVLNQFRSGDIRHCYADITRIRQCLGYGPRVGLREGLAGIASWLREAEAVDHFDTAQAALATRGLLR